MLYNNVLLQTLLDLVKSQPDFIVLTDNKRTITAPQLLNRSINVASNLKANGFRKSDVAVVAAQAGEEFLEIMYAVIMLQGKIAIIDPEMGTENYAAKIGQLQPQWMFIDSGLLFLQEHPLLQWIFLKIKKTLPGILVLPAVKLIAVGKKLPIVRKHISFLDLYRSPLIVPEFIWDEGLSENVIIYTSGTLSIPKGVLHTAKNLGASIDALSSLLNHNKNAVVGTYLPHFMLIGIAAGLPIKLMKQNISAAVKIKWIESEKVGILFGPPSDFMPLIQYCEAKNRKFPSSLEHTLIGSAPVHVSFLNRLISVLQTHTQITCTYGMTENLLVTTIDGRKKAAYNGKGDIVGEKVKGVSIQIEKDGEILVKSNQLFSRYLHEDKGKEWHSTGDLGEIDEIGNVILSGRKKEMIIRRNMNIYPALYENTIKSIKGIDEAAMIGVYDEIIHDEKVYLAVEGNDLNIKNIQGMLKEGQFSIDKEALPDYIFQMTIPRKGRQNKIDRKAIAEYIKKTMP